MGLNSGMARMGSIEMIQHSVEYFDVVSGLPKEHVGPGVNLDNEDKPLEDHEMALVHVQPYNNNQAYTDIYVLVGGLKNIYTGELTTDFIGQVVAEKSAKGIGVNDVLYTVKEIGLPPDATVEEVIQKIAQPQDVHAVHEPVYGLAIGMIEFKAYYFDVQTMAEIPKGVDWDTGLPMDPDECVVIHVKPYYNYAGYSDIFLLVGGSIGNDLAYREFVAQRVAEEDEESGYPVNYKAYTQDEFEPLEVGRGSVEDWVCIVSGFKIGDIPPVNTANYQSKYVRDKGRYTVSYFSRETGEPVWRDCLLEEDLYTEELATSFAVIHVELLVPFIKQNLVIPGVFITYNAPKVLKGNVAKVVLQEWAQGAFEARGQAWGSNRAVLFSGAKEDTVSSAVFSVFNNEELHDMRRYK